MLPSVTIDVPKRVAEGARRRDVFISPIEFTKTHAADLARIILVVVDMWKGATERLVTAYEPIITDAPADNERIIEEVERQISAVVLSLSSDVRAWAVRLERWHRDKWIRSVYSATNVDLGTVLSGQRVGETLDAFVARNVALIKDVSAQAQQRISDAVFRGYQERTSARDVAKKIREATDMARDRSIRIAGDQNSKLSAALDKERQLEAGFELGKYRHSGKAHPRSWHKARDGLIFDLKTRKQVNPDGSPMKGGQTIPADDWPGFPPFCGCRMGAYLPIEAEI